MARYLRLLGALSLALLFCPSALVAGEPGRPEKPWQNGNRPSPGPFAGDKSPQMENVRKALEALGPEQRRRFAENLLRWSNLSPEEKKVLREGEELRKKYMEAEINAAIAESGLQLDGERRAQFIRRFEEERKKIEEQLRKETMEKRKPMVRELIGRMKTEFSTPNP